MLREASDLDGGDIPRPPFEIPGRDGPAQLAPAEPSSPLRSFVSRWEGACEEEDEVEEKFDHEAALAELLEIGTRVICRSKTLTPPRIANRPALPQVSWRYRRLTSICPSKTKTLATPRIFTSCPILLTGNPASRTGWQLAGLWPRWSQVVGFRPLPPDIAGCLPTTPA